MDNTILTPFQNDWQNRVHAEHADLCIKHGKLEDFLNSEASNVLPVAELGRMRRQATYMKLYAEVLSERMQNFQ